MNPLKVNRATLSNLTDLPNIGPSLAEDLKQIGVQRPEQLRGMDPYDMYQSLCTVTGTRQDPCVLDVFISITRFMNGESPQPWWYYTVDRKRRYQRII